MFGIDDAVMGGLISGGLSLLGGERRNAGAAEQAQAANAFSAQQFATRYQTTVKDMEAAGLNPMLAYSQGGGTPPSGQQAQVQDTMSPAVEGFNRTRSTAAQNAVQNATVKNIEADTENKQAQSANIRADTLLKGAQENLAGASADQARTNISYLETQSKKIVEEIKNIPIEGQRLKALVENLSVEFDNIVARTHNVKAATDQIKMLAIKTMLEGDLLNFDVKAAQDLGNLGRYSKEGKIVLDIIREIRRGK